MIFGKKIGMNQAGVTAKSYVSDGLIAMWDGIENAGWGIHDESSLRWFDLIGNEPSFNVQRSGLSFTESGLNVAQTYDGQCYITISNGLYKSFTDSGKPNNSATLEWCWSCTNMIQSSTGSFNKVIFGYGDAGTSYFWPCSFQLQKNDSGFGFSGGPATNWAGYLTMVDDVNSCHTITTSKNGNYSNRYISINGIDYGYNTFNVTSQTIGTVKSMYILPNITTAWNTKILCTIHCIRCYNRQLSSKEILFNYNIDRSRFKFS